ncbi:hypothetical protein [Micromonospora sp. NBC_00421]|uniref:hypothetical protein n=1 Tax=Micromonospora sp. NBC_00421 TaxID=2975976 RepID=UPI002E215E34
MRIFVPATERFAATIEYRSGRHRDYRRLQRGDEVGKRLERVAGTAHTENLLSC